MKVGSNNYMYGCYQEIALPATERLIGGTSKVFETKFEERSSKGSLLVETRYEEKTDADNIPPLPAALEQRIKIIKVCSKIKN